MRTIVASGPYSQMGVPSYEAVIPHYVKCFPEYLRAAGYWCTNDGKHDYQFNAPVTVWDETSNPWFEDGTAHWRNRPDPDQPFFAVFNLGATHESQSWEGSQFDDNDIDPDVGVWCRPTSPTPRRSGPRSPGSTPRSSTTTDCWANGWLSSKRTVSSTPPRSSSGPTTARSRGASVGPTTVASTVR